MRKISLFRAPSVVLALLASAVVLPACGGSTPPPEAPPVAAPPPATAAPAPPPPPPEPAPAAVAPPPEAPKPHMNHAHMMAALFVDSLDSLDLTVDQKAQIDPIKSDMLKHAEVTKEPREKLEADVSDGVAVGKLDHTKTDADIRAMTAAVTATVPAMQDDINHLYKVLTPEQRKKLVDTIGDKAKHMHEHEGMPGGRPAATATDTGGAGSGSHTHEHENKGSEHTGDHPMHGGPGAPGMGEEGMLGKLSEELGLSLEQKDKLRMKMEPQMKAEHMAMKAKMSAAEKHMMAVGLAFTGDKFDAKKAGVGTDAPDTVQSITTAKVKFVETVLSVLTPEQRPKFVAQLKEHEAEME